MNIGIIGAGRYGYNYIKEFNSMDNANISWICSRSEDTLNKAKNELPGLDAAKATTNYEDILEDKDVGAVAIVTPGSTHYKLVKEALLAEKHVIVEKPLAFSYKDAKELVDLSGKQKKALMAGHLHLYNPGIRKLKEDIGSGLLGKINYFQFIHTGNGPIRRDMNALWDFFPHTVSILLYILGQMPFGVNASGRAYLQKDVEDIATMNLAFSDNVFATALCSWLYPLKKMQLVAVGEKKCAIFDDYSQNSKLKYYDSRQNIVNGKAIGDGKDYTAAKISGARPLKEQLKHFLDCIENDEMPLTGGDEALQVVKVLEHAQKSMEKDGAMVEIR